MKTKEELIEMFSAPIMAQLVYASYEQELETRRYFDALATISVECAKALAKEVIKNRKNKE